VNSGAFGGSSDLHQSVRTKRERPLEPQRLHTLLRRKEGERDPWHVSFLAAHAGPKRGVDHLFDAGHAGNRSGILTAAVRLIQEVSMHERRDYARGWVSRLFHS
jgi:hypothetical protein